MSAKVEVLEELGETAVLLPQLINRALVANDRIKYVLTLFQSARGHAEHPNAPLPSLQRERLASGVDDASFDTVVSSTTRDAASVLHMPQAARLHAFVVDSVREMLDPLKSVASGDATEKEAYGHYQSRFEGLVASAPPFENDRVPAEYIDAMTRGRGDRDSLHVLVMDLHRELNRLQMHIAAESLDGAKVYGIDAADRSLVSAFMTGVNATASLKFDHPGLGTTATRVGDRLIIQNDIGVTEAHVLVVHVVGQTIRVIYTDVHPARLAFFQHLLEPLGLDWTAQSPDRAGGEYLLRIGQVTVHEASALPDLLTVLGSRLVFLIDWNRARKRLVRFLKKADAVAVLTWAADHNVGHRAFLQLGDVELVDTAMERVARAQIRYGARLDEILGREPALAFLQAVLKIASEGLREGRSARLIQDEIQAELLTHVHSAEHGALNLAEEHAALVAGLADVVRDAVARFASDADVSTLRAVAARAKAWETRADDLVKRSRLLFEQGTPDAPLPRLLVEADNVADALEDAAFLLTLVPPHTSSIGNAANELERLADLVTHGARDYVRCVACGQDALRLGGRAELEEFLVAVDAVIAFEHASDERERAVKALLVETCHEFRELYVLAEMAGRLEQAADTLTRCAITLREYILNSLKARG